MKRALVFLLLGPIGGSLVTMLFNVQSLMITGWLFFSPKSFVQSIGAAFVFGYIIGIVPALVLGFVDWLMALNPKRISVVTSLAFLVGCIATARVFEWPWIIAAGVLAAAIAAVCSWLSGRST
jgi:hypothetical protein